ncbi:hypothetical protein ES703_106914 [subsurface metagenome]
MNEQYMKKKKGLRGKPLKESLTYLVEVTDKEGNVIQRIEAPSRSFVQQWNQVVNVQAKQTASTIKDTGGTNRSVNQSSDNLRIVSGAGVTNYGIRVGKGSTAVTISDYQLESPLAHGTGLDQLNHLAMSSTPPQIADSTCSFTIRRNMLNESGATISGIREIGAYMRMGSYYGLAFRDVLPSAVYVPHGGSITVTYTIPVTV